MKMEVSIDMAEEREKMAAFEANTATGNSAEPELIDTDPVPSGEPTAELLQSASRGREEVSKEKERSFSD